jgi:TRAP-type C4-dicarboxylate transport system substrate-binding protein
MGKIILCLLALWFALAPAIAQAAERLTIAHLYETSTAHHRWAVWAAHEIATRTDHRYEADVLARGEVGLDEAQLRDAVLLGALDMTFMGIGYAGAIYPPLTIGGAPYVFRDYEHWKKFRDGDLFAQMRAGFSKVSNDAHILGLMYYGQRHISARRPIRSLADLQGLTIRVPAQPPFTQTFRALGAKPVTMPFLGVYQALQQGMVEAQENPLPTISAMKFYEVSPHIALTGHVVDCLVMLMSGKRRHSIPAADRDIIDAVFSEAAAQASEEVRREESEQIAALRTKGVTVEDIDTEPLRKIIRQQTRAGAFPWDPTLYDRVQSTR